MRIVELKPTAVMTVWYCFDWPLEKQLGHLFTSRQDGAIQLICERRVKPLPCAQLMSLVEVIVLIKVMTKMVVQY